MGTRLMRKEGWERLLAEFVEQRLNDTFQYGVRDCCLFVCDGIEAMTGTDPGSRWRGLYTSEKGARRVLRDNGGVAGLAGLVLGAPVVAALAGRGDVVLIDTPDGEALALCIGAQIAAQGREGIEFHALASAKSAWKV